MPVYRLNPADFPDGNVKQFNAGNVLDDYYPSVAHGVQVSWDADQQAARMVMPSQSNQAGCGVWTRQSVFPRDQSTVGFAMRFRWDAAACDGGGYWQAASSQKGSFPKLAILHEGGASCQAQEFTCVNFYWSRGLSWYTACGAAGVRESIGGVGTYEFQPGGQTSYWYNGTNPDTPRAEFVPDVWHTYVVEFTRMDEPGFERAEVWLYPEGGTLSPNAWIKVLDYPFAAYSHGAAAIKWINSWNVGMYSTGKDATAAHTPWNAWYQDILLTPGPVRYIYGIESAVTAASESYTITAGTRNIAVGRYVLPSWGRNAAVRTWTTVPASNVMNDIDPGDSAVHNPNHPGSPPWNGTSGFSSTLGAWGGAAYDPIADEMHFPINGGHADYAGNEHITIGLRAAAPAFELRHPPSGSLAYLEGPTGTGADYVDGNAANGVYAFDTSRPRSVHGGRKFVWAPVSGGRIIMPALGGTYPDAGNGPSPLQSWECDPTDGTWTKTTEDAAWVRTPTAGRVPGANHQSCATWSADDELVYWTGANLSEVASYDPATQTKTSYATYVNTNNQVHMHAVELPGGRALVHITESGIRAINLDNLSVTVSVGLATTSGSFPAHLAIGRAGSIYYPDGQQIVMWGHTSNTTRVVVIDVPDNPVTGTYVIHEETADAANAVTPPVVTSQGILGRFVYAPNFKGIFFLQDTASAPLFYRLPPGGF